MKKCICGCGGLTLVSYVHGHNRRKAPRACSVYGCNKVACTRGWCQMHYKRWKTHGDVLASTAPQARHGLRKTSEYTIWSNMLARCYNPNSAYYKDYGGRGITVWQAWRGRFESFYQDMGPRPSKRYSLNRKNNDGPYAPQNCEWATKLEQANNTRKNVFITFQGKTLTVSQWAREVGVTDSALRWRLKREWPLERALG